MENLLTQLMVIFVLVATILKQPKFKSEVMEKEYMKI